MFKLVAGTIEFIGGQIVLTPSSLLNEKGTQIPTQYSIIQ